MTLNGAAYRIMEQADFIKEFNERNDLVNTLLTTLHRIDVY